MSRNTNTIAIRPDGVSVRALLADRETVEWAIRQLSVLRDSLFPAATAYEVVLTQLGDRKIEVIKEIRSHTGLGLKEAKDMAESPPGTVLLSTGLLKTASQFAAILESHGTRVNIRPVA